MDDQAMSQVSRTLEGASGDMEGKFLTFWIHGQLFGISISDVVQIVGMQKITEVPDYPHYAKGIINLRGSIIPLIDIRLRLGKPEREYDDRTCIIVANIGDRYFGFIVDEVEEVSDIADDQISPPPQLEREPANPYLIGIARLEAGAKGENIVLCLDVAKILGESELEALFSTTKRGE